MYILYTYIYIYVYIKILEYSKYIHISIWQIYKYVYICHLYIILQINSFGKKSSLIKTEIPVRIPCEFSDIVDLQTPTQTLCFIGASTQDVC